MQMEYYGLSHRPFEVDASGAGYFPALTFRKAITTIGQGLNKGGGIVFVSGPPGAGKTALLNHLAEKLEAEAVALAFVSAGQLGADDLLVAAARAFGVGDDVGEGASPLASLDLFLQDEARRGSRALLMIDDAQRLTEEGLAGVQTLAQLRLGDRALLQMVLACDEAFAAALEENPDLEDLRARATVDFVLDGLQPNEVGPYLDARLENADWDGRPEFDPAIPEILHQATGGNPGTVNEVMNRLLERGALEHRDVLDGEMIEDSLREVQSASHAEEEVVMVGTKEEGAMEEEVTEESFAQEGPTSSDHSAEFGDDTQPGPGAEPAPGLAEAQILAIEEAFAQRDRSYTRLRRELEELRERIPDGAAQDASRHQFGDRLEAIELRLEEQERVLRHLLTRMISVFEGREADGDD